MRAFVVLLLVAAGMAFASHGRWWKLPDRHNPWAPLTLDEPPGWLTRHKLQRLESQPFACRALLEEAAFRIEPVPDRETEPGCGFRDAVRVRRTSVAVGEPFVLNCGAALSLALWERHVLQPHALALLGARVRSLQHYGSYACRNVYGREAGPRSQHATANAFDVAGFTLDDGRRVTVARDALGDDDAGRFLRAVHEGACGLFDGVLGPGYNAAHADHFHFDRGPYRVCR